MTRDVDRPDRPRAQLPARTRLGAVVSTYHSEVGEAMLESARSELLARGLAAEDLIVVRAPGAFELPLIARRLAVREDVAAVLCLGLVLKGETSHDRYVAEAAREGILRVSLETDKPVLFGVLTCDTLEQARERRDKGREVAEAAVETLAALRSAAEMGARAAPVGFGGAPSGRREEARA